MKLRPTLIIAVALLGYYHYTRPRTISPGGTTPTSTPANTSRPFVKSFGDSSTVGGPEKDGVSVKCDLPISQHLKNKGGMGRGGAGTGSGLCVFTSIDMGADWGNYPTLIGFRDYMTKYPGGGDPDKVVQYIAKIAKDRNLPVPVQGVDYGQFTDGDDSKLDAIINTYRIAMVTYGYSPRYGGGNIAHMVCLVHIDKDCAAVLDNNFPGTIEWMSRAEFVRRWKLNHGGWGFWLGNPPPPPVPVNS